MNENKTNCSEIMSAKARILKPVNIPWQGKVSNPIRTCPGFAKKKLAEYKIDLMAFCQFGCVYCSSNAGNLMRTNSSKISQWAVDAVGVSFNPRQDADKFYMTYPGVIEALEQQLIDSQKIRNINAVLQFGMLVDNFSPTIVKDGTTMRALEILLEKTKFTIRILTKSAAVAGDAFIELFQRYPNRVTVGLSCGSLNNTVTHEIELFTSLPAARAKAIRTLQKAGVRTFLMACPVLPGFATEDQIEELYAAFDPNKLETAWCEPYNDRANWRMYSNCLSDTDKREALTSVMTDKREWSKYALKLARLHEATLIKYGFTGESIYLLYESGMTEVEIEDARKIPGVLFQSGQVEQ